MCCIPMDSSYTKKPKMDDLEVTGVSRSGRVRKKSSKLMDFESPDEIDRPYKKHSAAARKIHIESPLVSSELQSKKDLQPQRQVLKMEEDTNIEDRFRDDPNDSNTSDYEPNMTFSNRSNTLSTDSLDSEQSDLDTSASTSQGLEGSVSGAVQVVDNGQFQKLTDTSDDRMGIERSTMQIQGGQNVLNLGEQEVNQGKNKRLVVIKYGRIVSRSTNQAKGGPQRKTDKTDRPRSIATIASTIPNLSHSNKKLNPTVSCKSINSQQTTQQQRGRTPQQVSPKTPVYQLGLPSVGNHTTSTISPPSPRGVVAGGHNKNDHIFKVNGIKPIDVAAHLKLLGESLTIIGERLKEHEGQIAVSGSLSVLLDSLLCALGPLLCLTQQVPELQENCCDPEQLTSTLDNVAFIMPGL